MTVWLLLVALGGAAVPHLFSLRRAAPASAAAIWLSALSLRSLAVILGVGWLILYFPGTELFDALTHWCWRHLTAAALSGHEVGHVTTLVPAVLGVLSLVSVVVAMRRVGRSLRSLLSRARAAGPAGSVIVGGGDVSLAVVGFRRPRVVVSAGALLALDDEELAAALAHERGHIAHRHRYLLLYAQLCGAVARLVPGTKAAVDELAFHLERDADRWALGTAIDRDALAAALRKAAGTTPDSPAMALGGSRVEERLNEILGDADEGRRGGAIWRTLAATLVVLTVAVAASAPPALAAGLAVVHTAPAHASSDC